MKKFAAAIGVVAATLGTTLTLCPSAVAAPACPYDMSTQAGKDALTQAIQNSSEQSWQDEQAYIANGNTAPLSQDEQNERNASKLALACQGITSPVQDPPPVPPPPPPGGGDPDLAAVRALGDHSTGQAPNCSAYGQKYDAVPAGVDAAESGADIASNLRGAPDLPIPNGSDVLMTCGLANSVIAGVDTLTGNFDGAAQAAQQATIGDCWAGKHMIPFVTIPGNCG